MENSNLLNPKESRASNCGEEEEGNKHHGQNSDDRISDLPDDILHHILSFLPIKSVVQTSILSRRWSYLWASFPFLNFSTGIHEGIPDCQQSIALMEFISRVLSRRHENSNIKVFRVAGHMSCSRLQYDILSRVLKHKVGHLELKIFLLSDLWDDPHCLFECDSLRRLELESISDNLPSETNIPYIYLWAKSSGLRSLHTLSLKRVNLLDSALDLVDLFSSSSSFPFLERLAIENCNIVIPDLKISCPSLKDLKVSKIEINSLEISGMRLENLEVYFPSYHCTNAITWVKIFAPNLQTFSWVCDMITEKYSIGSFPILRESYIHISEKFMFHIGRRAKINLAVDLLSVASQVQDLSILGHGDFQILSNIYFEGGLPFSFVNLKILYISSTLEKCEIPGLACLFKSSPIAHSLTIEIHHVPQSIENWNNTLLDDADCTVEQYWELQAQSLTSFLSQLKEVKIHVWNFIGFVHESAVKTARFLLKHGRGLQKMSLSSEYTDDQPLWKDKVDLFQGVSCASAHVKIVVEHQNSVNGDCYSYPLLYNSGHWYFA